MSHKRKNQRRTLEKLGKGGPKERRGHVNGIITPDMGDLGPEYKPRTRRRRTIVSGAVHGIGRPRKGKQRKAA